MRHLSLGVPLDLPFAAAATTFCRRLTLRPLSRTNTCERPGWLHASSTAHSSLPSVLNDRTLTCEQVRAGQTQSCRLGVHGLDSKVDKGVYLSGRKLQARAERSHAAQCLDSRGSSPALQAQ